MVPPPDVVRPPLFAAKAVPAIRPTTSAAMRAPSRMAWLACVRTDPIRISRDLPGLQLCRLALNKPHCRQPGELDRWTQSRGFASPAHTGFAFVVSPRDGLADGGGKGREELGSRRALSCWGRQ